MNQNELLAELKRELLGCRTVAIAGAQKNTGKTTTLNFFIRMLQRAAIGVTSVGRDGEQADLVTHTSKPRIYINSGTIVATAKRFLIDSDATFEILSMSGIGTAVGEIVLAKSRSCGFIELAGPSVSKQLASVCETMRGFGASPILIDGALSRKTFAVPDVADACIYCTGGAVSCDVESLVKKTRHELNLLTVRRTDEATAARFDEVMKDASLAFIYRDHTEKSGASAIGVQKEMVNRWSDDLNAVFVKGALTNRFLINVMDCPDYGRVRLVAQDGTKLFFSDSVFQRFLNRGGNLTVKKEIRLLGVSVNPTSPDGGRFNFERFLYLLKQETSVPIFNLKEFGADVIT